MAVCLSCGFDNPPGMRFCGQCGARLAPTEPAPSSAEPTGEFSSARLGVMMGADLLERFRQAGLEAAGQRRTVTVLFVDISGFTTLSGQLEAEDLYALIQPTLNTLAQAVYQYDGTVDKFTGDGLMALFGAPIAHENNPELAVRSALEMQARIQLLNQDFRQRFGADLQLHIGLHAGPVIVGGIGSDLLMNYTAVGDTVNLARRLEEAASPGTIIVSESVFRQTQAICEYEPTPPLTLKGFSQPLPGYRVTGLKTQPGSRRGLEGLHAPLIGRDAEFTRLKKAVTALVTQSLGQMVLVTGEGGIGKSRLTSELKTLMRESSVRMIEGFSLTYRRTASYWTFLEAIRNLLGVTADSSDAQLRDRLVQYAQERLGPAAAEALPYLEYWLGLPLDDPAAATRLRYLEAGQLRRQIFVAVRDLLVAEARRQPVWLILEDWHWTDDASLELLSFLLESVTQVPLLIYILARPFSEPTILKVVDRARELLADRLIEVPLHSLSNDQSERLLFQLLPIANFPEAWLQSILQRAAGIPYYLEEILRMLLDHGVVRREGGRWQLDPRADLESLTVPETLQALILARFDRLGQTDRHVLQAASVIGREFNAALLAAILAPLAAPSIDEALGQLTQREFIQPSAELSLGEYSFKHVLVSDAIYSTLLRRNQSDLHGRVGEALESLYADQLEKNTELLARHYSFSQRHERALHYLILAGQKAARAYLNDQARQYFEQALTLLPQAAPTVEQQLQALAGLGDVLVFAGEYASARVHYQAALDGIPGSLNRSLAAERSELLRKLGAAFLKQSDYDQALGAFAAAQSALSEADLSRPVASARILSDVGWAHFERGELEMAQQHLMQGLELLEGVPAPDIESSLYNRLGAVAYRRGDWAGAADCVRKSAELREMIGDRVGLAGSLNNLGVLDIALGNFEDALLHLQRSLELRKPLGDVEGGVVVQNNLGYLHISRGDLKSAAEVLMAAVQIARELNVTYLLIQSQRLIGEMHVAAGRWEEAQAVLEECIQLATESGAQDQLAEVYRLLGEAWLGAGQMTVAREWALKARQLMTGTQFLGPTEERGYLLRLFGAIAIEYRDWQNSEAFLRNSEDIFDKIGNHLGGGRVRYQMARLALAQTDDKTAALLLREAQSIFERLGARLDLSATNKLLAQLSLVTRIN